MKALDKAAHDRDQSPAAASGQPRSELTLEAIEPQRSAGQAANTARIAPARGVEVTERTGNHYNRVTAAPTSTNAGRTSAQLQAANVFASGLQARSSGGVLTWMQANPLFAFGAAAALFLAIYGAYVYVQVAHPAWLAGTQGQRQPVGAAPVTPPAVPPAPATGANTAPETAPTQTAEGSGTTIVPMSAVFGRGSEFSAPAPQPAPPSFPVSKAPPNTPAGVPPAMLPPAPPATTAPRATITTEARPAAPSTLLRDKIAISRADSATPRVNPAVSDAYNALQAGQFDTAQRLYQQALRGEPANVDALLGLAAIAQSENRNDDAQRHYLAILDIEPRHALAQSGLIALMGRADPQASETRLKQLLAREPSAPLYFNLGNLYAEQGLWAQAQQAYFQSHQLEPRNPDYAYNLAVGLEHLGQPKLALDFYRKALQLAPAAGAANFDIPRTQERIKQLAARVN